MIQPNSVADDLRRKAVAVMRVRWQLHATSLVPCVAPPPELIIVTMPWDGQQATLGNFVHVGLSGNDAIVTMTATANGAVTGTMDLHDSGALSFSGLLSHAIW